MILTSQFQLNKSASFRKQRLFIPFRRTGATATGGICHRATERTETGKRR
jgi:hypothetical protein